MRNRSIAGGVWTTSVGSRHSRMHPASVSARPSRRSASRSSTSPPSDEIRPPSKSAVTFLPYTAGRTNGRRVSSVVADVALSLSRWKCAGQRISSRCQRLKPCPPSNPRPSGNKSGRCGRQRAGEVTVDRFNGAWQVQFQTLDDGYVEGSGLIAIGFAILRNGQVLGGDMFCRYEGQLQEQGEAVKGEIKVTPHFDMRQLGFLTAFLESRSTPFNVHIEVAPGDDHDLLLGSVELMCAEDGQQREKIPLLMRRAHETAHHPIYQHNL